MWWFMVSLWIIGNDKICEGHSLSKNDDQCSVTVRITSCSDSLGVNGCQLEAGV